MRSLAHAYDRWRERRERARAQDAADRELLRAPTPPLRLAWRAQELTTTRSRLDLAHEARSCVRHARARLVTGASPVNRRAVRAKSTALLAIADRLADLDRPVAPRGVVMLRRLLDDLAGPLFDPDRAGELGTSLAAVRDALEPR
jgi:hypothetical protein